MINRIVQLAENSRAPVKLALALLFVLLVLAVYALVWFTGGIKYVYSHTMYLVIISSALILGVRGGVTYALLGGIALGPLMPIDVVTGERQEAINWLYRLFYFVLVGFLVGGFSELTRKHLRQVKWQLEHNAITRLPNRNRLYHDLDNDELSRPRRLYLVFVANLQELELRLGADVREVMIGTLVERMRKHLSGDITLYHVRANHIALLIRDSEGDAFSQILGELSAVSSEPVLFENVPLIPVCVTGSVDIDGGATGVREYLRRAEICVVQARSRGILYLHYSPGLEESSRRNVELLGLLKGAMDSEALHLQYQPKYALQDHRITGMEALLRWHDTKRGFIGPASFIPVVENSQLIRPLTLWVIRRALLDLKQLQQEQLAISQVAINVSASNLLDPQFIRDVAQVMKETDAEPSCIELEVTETGIMRDFEFCCRQISSLRSLGFRIALDDFGTGYSSLQYLDRIPFTSVKLDQAFIRELRQHDSKQIIVNAAIRITHDLNAHAVAEGIEDYETESLLSEMDCDAGQGFHFSRPLTLDKLREFMGRQAA